MKHNNGFTLVELLCAIVAGSIVTAATATILLLGLRMNANANEMATQDNQAVICLTVMENMIKEKNVVEVKEEDGQKKINVKVDDTTTEALFTFTADGKIKTSAQAVLLEDVYACEFEMSADKKTIKIKLQLDKDEEPFVKTVRLITGQPIKLAP